MARRRGKPWRFRSTVIVARHRDVAEALSRDLDFLIAPINEQKIDEVNGPFILGMDRSERLIRERRALYSALSRVDLDELEQDLHERSDRLLATLGSGFDAIRDYARPLAVGTAMKLFGIAPPDRALFAEVARAIFAHTFLNQGNDKAVRDRAAAAAPLLATWLASEIADRRAKGTTVSDLMGRLLAQPELDDDGVRRTLGGMLVGSIDTTVSAVAKIIWVLDDDARLAAIMARSWQSERDIYGLCLEALRRWPHNPIVLRSAAADTELAGASVKRGDRVLLWTQAAMLDAEAFPYPKEARPDRPHTSYLHFGAGLHPCTGRGVNGRQIPLLVGSLLARGVRRTGSMGWAGPFPDRLPIALREPV